jgi:hypothetical protein
MKQILVFATLALIAAACSSAPQSVSTPAADLHARVPTPNTGSGYDVAGLLEVTISEFKPNSSEGTASAKFYGTDKSGKLSAKGLLVPSSSVAFTPQFVSSFDATTGPTTTRYIEAGFAITNNSPTTYYNMTMIASSLAAASTASSTPTTTVGGTALSDVLNGLGTPITDVAVARSMIPVHGFTAGSTYAPNVNLADLHYLTAAEAASVKAQGQATGQIPAVNINKVFPLEYGFVGRNAVGTGRTIGSSSCVGTNCNKGRVTFAYAFPLDSDVTKQPRTFKMQFVVASEFIATWSQMLTDDVVSGVRTVAAVPYANPLISTHRTRILENGGADKTFVPATGTDTLENVCAFRIANAVVGSAALQYPSVPLSGVGGFDGCFGEKGMRGKRFSDDYGHSSSISIDPVTDEVVMAGTVGPRTISLQRFDKKGTQTLSVQYLPSVNDVGLFPASLMDVTVKKVIVSRFNRQIYVFGFAIGGPSIDFPEFGIYRSGFILATGQKSEGCVTHAKT